MNLYHVYLKHYVLYILQQWVFSWNSKFQNVKFVHFINDTHGKSKGDYLNLINGHPIIMVFVSCDTWFDPQKCFQ